MKPMVRFVPLLLALTSVAATAQLKMGPTGPVVLHNGAGAAEFTVTNTGATAVPLDLKAGPFTDETSHAVLSKPKVAFVLEAGGGSLPAKLGPHQTMKVEANVSDLAGSSAANTTLFSGNTELGEITALEADAPLNVSIDGAGTADNKLAYPNGGTATIVLKNGDAEAYPVEWALQIDGVTQQHGELTLAPNGSSRIDLKPDKGVYSWTDDVHPSARTGLLLLNLHSPDGTDGPDHIAKALLPARTLPVELLMMRTTSTRTKVFSYIFVTLVLLIGGLLSLLGNSVLPGIVRKIGLRDQIAGLADRTSSVSTRVDSYLRVLLRLERKKIDIMVRGLNPFWLTSADTFEQVPVAIDRLNKRLTLAERLDGLRRKFEDASATAPPSVTDDIDRNLQAAADQLHPFALPEEGLNAARAFLDKAEASLDSLGDTAAQAKLIAENFKDLKARLTVFPRPYYQDLQAALPGVFRILDQAFDDPKNITSPMMFAIDHGIAAMQTALDYAVVRATVPAAAPAIRTERSKLAKDRLLAHEPELIGLLGTLSWQALREATILVEAMRQGIYEDDVLQEIGRKDQAAIVIDTQRARPYLPVYFSIDFKDPWFNGAAAIGKLACRWSFPSDLQEEGWKVCHFFQGDEKDPAVVYGNYPDPDATRKVKIAVTVQSHRALEPPKSLEKTIEIQPPQHTLEYSRALAEGLRFLIAFGVALAGLLSGALTQLEKLDFITATIAILALGFGADSIKNLLTQTPTKPAS